MILNVFSFLDIWKNKYMRLFKKKKLKILLKLSIFLLDIEIFFKLIRLYVLLIIMKRIMKNNIE